MRLARFQFWLVAGAAIITGGTPARAEQTLPKTEWDQVANIKDAAARIGKLQRAKGAEAAYKFIDACYRTHTLAENYTAGFEACIAQDYVQTKMLVQLYSRTPPEALRQSGSPSAEKLSEVGGKRIVAAFAQYKIPVEGANAFKALVDKHGVPVFLNIVFPEAVKEVEENRKGKKPKQ